MRKKETRRHPVRTVIAMAVYALLLALAFASQSSAPRVEGAQPAAVQPS